MLPKLLFCQTNMSLCFSPFRTRGELYLLYTYEHDVLIRSLPLFMYVVCLLASHTPGEIEAGNLLIFGKKYLIA